MEPHIQYAQTKDGVSIAFWTLGEGMPFVLTPPALFGHIQLEWQNSLIRSYYERLALKRKVIRYDHRGSGLSERNPAKASLDTFLLDLEAVVGHLGLTSFALVGHLLSGPVAIAYAARHPEQVSQLVLWCTWAERLGTFITPELEAVRGMQKGHWETFTETLSHVFLGWEADEEARWFAEYMRESITPADYEAYRTARHKINVAELLPRVMSPTLVLHRRQVASPPLDSARHLASRIPRARLVLLEGKALQPWVDSQPVVTAIDDFLGEGEEAAVKTEPPEGMAVILFADIANSTALTEQLGDAAFRKRASELDASLRATITASGGTPVEGKLVGDGIMAVFTSARQAIEAALKCGTAGESVGLELHVGIHAGDVIREGNNVYGGAVNIAARIAGESAAGEVLVSQTVRGLARTSAGVAFDDRGEHELKGVGEPQRLFAVREGSG